MSGPESSQILGHIRTVASMAEGEIILTQQSLAISPRPQGWIDQTFLWTLSSLTVMAIAATLATAARWPPGPAPGLRSAPRALARPWSARPVPRSVPKPLIAFADPEPGYPVISPFGLRQLPWEEAGRLHKGVDIAAPRGEPVLAAADGVVLQTGVDGGYGRFIKIGHAAGMSSLYGHLSAFEARPGMRVREGQPIGKVGSTGSSTGSHLHFEIHDAGDHALNPEMFMGRRFMTRADLPLRTAARTSRRVRVAYVSYIPPAKAAELAARQEERSGRSQAQLRAGSAAALRVLPPRRVMLIIAPGAITGSTTASSSTPETIQIARSGPDGRVHGQISPGG